MIFNILLCILWVGFVILQLVFDVSFLELIMSSGLLGIIAIWLYRKNKAIDEKHNL